MSSKVRIPIATGENLFLFDGFQDIIASHALSIVTPDLQKVGGLAVAQTIAQFADAHTMPVAPHNVSSPVGTLAVAHFAPPSQTSLLSNFMPRMFPSGMILPQACQSRSFRMATFPSRRNLGSELP